MTCEHEYESEAGTACERIAKVLGVTLNKRNPLAVSLHGLATVLEAYAKAPGRLTIDALAGKNNEPATFGR